MFQVELPCTVFLFEYDVGDEKTAEHKEKLYTYAPTRPYIIEPGECCNGQVEQEYLEKRRKTSVRQMCGNDAVDFVWMSELCSPAKRSDNAGGKILRGK